jgi:hypothetical protein
MSFYILKLNFDIFCLRWYVIMKLMYLWNLIIVIFILNYFENKKVMKFFLIKHVVL